MHSKCSVVETMWGFGGLLGSGLRFLFGVLLFVFDLVLGWGGGLGFFFRESHIFLICAWEDRNSIVRGLYYLCYFTSMAALIVLY